jgi:hypothetical protein
MESNQDTGQVADSERGELIERMVLDVIQRQNLTKVGEVVANLQRFDKFLTTEEIHDAAKRLERRGEVNLSEEKISPSFLRNLGDIQGNAPFWIAILGCIGVLAASFALPQDESWMGVRQAAIAIFLFIIPGYVTTNALIPRNRLSYVERIAVSVGLSLATVALVGVVLAYGISGIKQEPIVISLTALVVALALVGAYKDFRRRHEARTLHRRFLGEQGGTR